MDFLCGYEPLLRTKMYVWIKKLSSFPLDLLLLSTLMGGVDGTQLSQSCPISIREGSRCVNIDTRYVYGLLNGPLSEWVTVDWIMWTLWRMTIMNPSSLSKDQWWCTFCVYISFGFDVVRFALCVHANMHILFLLCLKGGGGGGEGGWGTGLPSLERRDRPAIISLYHVIIIL